MDLLAHFTDTLPALLSDVEELVRCESPSDDRSALERSAQVTARVGARRLGVQPERVVLDGCPHLRWRFGSGARRVLLLGHHDTVWPLGSLARHPFGVTDGVLRGPGCFDMKTGLAIAIHAVAALPERDGVTILVTGDEEIGSTSSRALVEAEAVGCAAALVLEAAAAGGALKTERKGVSFYEFAIEGRAAHAGLEPESGVNGAVELAHQILAATALADPGRGTSVTTSVARAGTTSNTVPAGGGFTVDVRAESVEEQERIDSALRALRPVLPGARLTLSGGPNRPPLPADSSDGLFARAAVLAAELGLPPLVRASVGGGSDGNFTAGVGTPTLDGLGAVGGGAHADSEHVLVEALPGRTALVAALVADVLATGARSFGTNPPPAARAARP